MHGPRMANSGSCLGIQKPCVTHSHYRRAVGGNRRLFAADGKSWLGQDRVNSPLTATPVGRPEVPQRSTAPNLSASVEISASCNFVTSGLILATDCPRLPSRSAMVDPRGQLGQSAASPKAVNTRCDSSGMIDQATDAQMRRRFKAVRVTDAARARSFLSAAHGA